MRILLTGTEVWDGVRRYGPGDVVELADKSALAIIASGDGRVTLERPPRAAAAPSAAPAEAPPESPKASLVQSEKAPTQDGPKKPPRSAKKK